MSLQISPKALFYAHPGHIGTGGPSPAGYAGVLGSSLEQSTVSPPALLPGKRGHCNLNLQKPQTPWNSPKPKRRVRATARHKRPPEKALTNLSCAAVPSTSDNVFWTEFILVKLPNGKRRLTRWGRGRASPHRCWRTGVWHGWHEPGRSGPPRALAGSQAGLWWMLRDKWIWTEWPLTMSHVGFQSVNKLTLLLPPCFKFCSQMILKISLQPKWFYDLILWIPGAPGEVGRCSA